MRKRLSHLTYANVVATLALFLAVAGGTTAVALNGSNNVDANDIQQGAVAGREVKNESLFKRDLGKGAAGTSEIAGSSVTGGKIADGTVWSRELGTGAVTAEDIKDGTIGTIDVADGQLGGADILDRSIGQADLAAVAAARVTSPGFNVADSGEPTVDFDDDTGPGTYDPSNMWRPANPDALVAPVDGVYVVTGEARWEGDDSASAGGLYDVGQRYVELIGENAQRWSELSDASRAPDGQQTQVVTGIFNLQAGEEVEMVMNQTNEDASAVGATAVIGMTWVGPSPGPVPGF